jgi:hypothetical protein
MYLEKEIRRKNSFFVGVLKVKDENSRIWSRIRRRIHWSEARVRGSGSGSVPKCHGSTTLAETKEYPIDSYHTRAITLFFPVLCVDGVNGCMVRTKRVR